MEPSYASGTSSTPLLGDTIGDNLDRTRAVRRPQRAGLRPSDRRYTYAQFAEAVDGRPRCFAAGIEPVTAWDLGPNCAEWTHLQ